MTVSFSIEESLEFGWKKTREHSRVLFFSLLIFLAVMLSDSLLNIAIDKNSSIPFAIVLGLAKGVFVLATLAMSIGFIVMQLEIVRNKKPTLMSLVPSWNVVVRYVASTVVLATFIFGAVLGVSVLALVLDMFLAHARLLELLLFLVYMSVVLCAMVYVSVRFILYRFVAVEDEESITAILVRSLMLTRGAFWNLLLFVAVVLLLNIAGLLFFGVGLLITIPVSVIAMGHVYTTLSASKK